MRTVTIILLPFVLFGKSLSYTIGMNNSFNDSIASICGLELATLAGGYKYSVFGGTTAVIEGHKGIAGYQDDEVAFFVTNALLKVRGSKLHIRCLSKNFAVVNGSIGLVEVVAR